MYDLTVGIVSYHNRDEIVTLIDSIERYTKGVKYRIYVVDNGSPKFETAMFMREAYPHITVLCRENEGFGTAHNALIPYMDSRYHAVVNPDISIQDDIFTELVGYLDANPDCAMVQPDVIFPDGTPQPLPKRAPSYRFLILGRLGNRIKAFRKYRTAYTRADETFTEPTEVDFCSGCFFVTRTAHYKKLGGFDQDYFMYLEDADLTERMQSLGKTVYYPNASVIHHWKGGSRQSKKLLFLHIRSMFLYMKKRRRLKKKLKKLKKA